MSGQLIVDVGGGKNPFVDADTKKSLFLHVVGLDIDPHELERAPPGLYDKTICADICECYEHIDADLVIAQSIMEHVPNAERALLSMHRLLRDGGMAAIFLPSKYAMFSYLNRLLPERIKKGLLFYIYLQSRNDQGFKAYYSRASIKDYRLMADKIGFEVVEVKPFYASGYFSFFFPMYFLWRIWMLIFRGISRENAAETFCILLRKRLTPAALVT